SPGALRIWVPMGCLSAGGCLPPERLDVLAQRGVHLRGDIPTEAGCVGHVGLVDVRIDPQRDPRFGGLRDDEPALRLAEVVLRYHVVIGVRRHSLSFPHGWLLWPKSAGYPRRPHRHR